ncbi:MAG: hypothetical protein JWL73_2685 [Actinomycetia bacterium]|nr:hypothetical protein [Actinomycetes bacterium]
MRGCAMGQLDGRIAYVVGGASGIGAAVVSRFEAAGARVGVIDQVASDLGEVALVADVADAVSVDAALAELAGLIGAPDALAHTAGIGHSGDVAGHDDADWRRVIDVNLTGPFHTIRSVLPGMIERGYGRIVALSSGTGVRVGAGRAAYGASKGGLISLVKGAAMEAAPHGVTVNAIAPGLVDSPMTRRLMPTDAALLAAATSSAIANPTGRVMQPDDIARVVEFLSLPDSWAITGQTIHVNAGALMP